MSWRSYYYAGVAWPGHGPWSHLPPPLRPGYWLGRGWCWRYIYTVTPYYPLVPSKEVELKYLEDLKSYLMDYLKSVEKRIEELKSK